MLNNSPESILGVWGSNEQYISALGLEHADLSVAKNSRLPSRHVCASPGRKK